MSKLVTIYGGSGFLGRYIARRMAQEGWRVRVAVRRDNEALFVRTYGALGQVEPVRCNIRDDASVRGAMQGADAVVNCVGILVREGKNTFDAVQAQGAARIARIATEMGVARLVHVSAIGAETSSTSNYAGTKAAGEAAVRTDFPSAVILRPSVMFGSEDGFFNKFAMMARWGVVLPIVGASTRFQPVYVDDVAKAAVKAVLGEASGTYELGGPDAQTMRELIDRMLAVTLRRRIVVNTPFWVAYALAAWFDSFQFLWGGLIVNRMLTRDQVKLLRHDNVVGANARGFADLGIEPTPMAAVLPDYLWRFRPTGQFDAIKASAKNLRKPT
ncbi:MAG: complex I NDUFA9 subunit family protein [Phaeovulum sp.]|uniref:complex I NDUFA9 subunit family protein n=1 Tax=Phaeovulum sp. TaxID=2934796 RepID=UPI002734C1D8|nr:complex I NDUFA9 subunit family protein [Phaeovulum sp.]MDP3862877.1 complex I NDUFA9 subunit family protein [Phaeovulum sp.]